MRIAYSANRIGSNCPEPNDPCACGIPAERLAIRIQVTSRPKCLTFFGFEGGDCLCLNRLLGCGCVVEKPILDCDGNPLKIDECNCEVMLIKPGMYEFTMEDRSEIYPEIAYEEMAIGVEWTRLICECGDVNYA